MLTRKLMASVVAVTVGLIGLGVACGGDGPPVEASAVPAARAEPTPVTSLTAAAVEPAPGAAGGPERDWRKNEARMRSFLALVRREQEAGTQAVVIDAAYLRVPTGFCERSGLTDDKPANTWFLSERERRMFSALLQAEAKASFVLDWAQTTRDGEPITGHQLDYIEVATGSGEKPKDGKAAPPPKASTIGVGVTLQVTPKVVAGGRLRLGVRADATEPRGRVPVTTPAADGKGGAKTEFLPFATTSTFQTTVEVPDAGTVVIRTGSHPAFGAKPAAEALCVLTAYAIRGEKKPAAPASKP
jgi:hypothetical protein